MSPSAVRDLNVVICAYSIDRNDVGEALMAYNWASRLAEFVNLWVVTAGSRLNQTCGLEDNPRVKLTTLRPFLSFAWADRLDRAVHPGYLEYYLRARKAVKAILAKDRIDVCHQLAPRSVRHPSVFVNLGVPFVIGPLHGGLQPPEVMAELNGKEEGWLTALRRVDMLRGKLDPLLRGTCRQAQKILISAPYMLGVLPAECAEKCRVVPGVAMERPDGVGARQAHEGPVKLLFVGRIVPSKGIELLIQALTECRPGSCTLSIYGRGTLETYCRRLAQDLGVDKYIAWKGFVGQEEVYEAYRRHDVFILPSLKEPAGGAVIEAMAAGLPVVCVDAGGPAYAVESDCGVKIGLSDRRTMVSELARAIDSVAADPDRRTEMGRKARQRVQAHFTWDAVIAKVLRVYDEIASQSAR